jgi:hypothetical protein
VSGTRTVRGVVGAGGGLRNAGEGRGGEDGCCEMPHWSFNHCWPHIM